MKRFLSLILTVAMLFSLTAVASAGETATLKVMFYTNALTKDFNEVAFIQNMAKDANVTLEIEQISGGWDEIKSTLLASGDIPDMIIGKDAIVSSDIAQFKDLFADMSGMIDEYAPNIRKAFDAHPELEYLVEGLGVHVICPAELSLQEFYRSGLLAREGAEGPLARWGEERA